MASLYGGSSGSDPSKNLAALALRKKGDGELEKGNFAEAEVLLSQVKDSLILFSEDLFDWIWIPCGSSLLNER